ncbi:MAG: LysE family transporter [Thermodesulfobacteriota bacterium]
MIHYLAIGTLLGLSAGLAPGPLLALVLSETLRRGVPAGVRVAFAPLVTDLPVVLLTLLVLSRLSGFHQVLGMISLAGGCFLIFNGCQIIAGAGAVTPSPDHGPHPLLKGILANVLSPHPFLFWLSVGAPTVVRAMGEGLVAPCAFVLSFYFFLVGSKVTLAMAAGKSRRFLQGRAYLYSLRIIGGLLLVLAGLLIFDGLRLLHLL